MLRFTSPLSKILSRTSICQTRGLRSNVSGHKTRSHMLTGVFAPISTPFNEKKDLDLEQLRSNVSKLLLTKSVQGLVVLGSNGEFPLLTTDERIQVLETTAKVVHELRSSGQVTIEQSHLLAGTGSPGTRETALLSKEAAKFGYDALIVVTPYYYTNLQNHAALFTHFTKAAASTKLPLVLYSMPQYAGGVSISNQLALELSQHEEIIGIKDSSGNVGMLASLIQSTRKEDFGVLAGSGSYFVPALSVGAIGGVMAIANLIPKEMQAIYKAWSDKDYENAIKLQESVLELNQAVTIKYSVPGLKYALEQLGYYGGPCRSPFAPLSDNQKEEIAKLVAPFKERK